MADTDLQAEELRKAKEALEIEVARLRRENTFYRTEHKTALYLVTVILLGPGLSRALEAWVRARRAEAEVPVEITVELAGSVIRRCLKVSLVGVVLAVIPVGLLAAQVILMRHQNSLIGQQNAFFQDQTRELQAQTSGLREQNDQQIRESQLARRAQLVASIYDQKEPCSDPIGCPRANLRARIDAVRSFVEIERAHNRMPNLLVVDLRDAVIQGEDFHGVNFSGGRFDNAILSTSDLSNCSFASATMPMDLSWSNLSGSDLMGATVTQNVLDSAYGDDQTVLPIGVRRPVHWSTRESPQSYEDWLSTRNGRRSSKRSAIGAAGRTRGANDSADGPRGG